MLTLLVASRAAPRAETRLGGGAALDWPPFSCRFEQDAYICAGSYERDILTLEGDLEDEIGLDSGY